MYKVIREDDWRGRGRREKEREPSAETKNVRRKGRNSKLHGLG